MHACLLFSAGYVLIQHVNGMETLTPLGLHVCCTLGSIKLKAGQFFMDKPSFQHQEPRKIGAHS